MTAKKEKIYKHKEYGHVYGTRHRLQGGRLVWLQNLGTPKEFTGELKPGQVAGKPTYQATYLVPKDNAVNKEALAVLDAEVKEMLDLYNFDEKTGKPHKQRLVIDTYLQDGDDADVEKYPFLAGNFIISSATTAQPELYNAKLKEVTADHFQGGMPATVLVKPVCSSKGVKLRIVAIQAVKDDGVRFGGGTVKTKDLLSACTDEESVAPAAISQEVEEEDIPAPTPAAKPAKASKGNLNLDKLG